MYLTQTQMAKKYGIPQPRMKEILIAGGVYEHDNWGYWEEEKITRWKNGREKVYWKDCFHYDMSKLRQDMADDYMRYTQAVGKSRKAKKFFIQNYGI